VQTHEYGFNVGLLFFGVTAIIYGYLIVQSGYFPKLLGILVSLAERFRERSDRAMASATLLPSTR
jgi:hypothetical protein